MRDSVEVLEELKALKKSNKLKEYSEILQLKEVNTELESITKG